MIARLFTDIVQYDPTYEIKYVQQNVKEKYQYEISYHKIWYGLKRARKNVYGTWESSARRRTILESSWWEGALHPHIVHILYDIGFYGVYRCGHFDMDFHLITALVERWRPETHTFYFRIGEMTVTLQDVAVIWSLPVDGQPVIGVDLRRSTEQLQDYCHHYLGFRPTSQQFRGGRILLSVLRGILRLTNDR
ncbi:hypothetical protein Pfo_002436 [Paulownia fortunei]|nr:hypothetical protein Pfo_002436 [Paulownia fortunei]